MNTKDLRTDSALGARINDGSTKYAQSGNSLQYKSNKPYQDIGTNSLAKVDVQTSRPCAIIGPDRILPSPNCNDGFVKKTLPESWPCPDNVYRQPPDYPQKMSEFQPTRNISPRQTFQENMQRIMVTPYSSVKKSDDPNFPVDHSATMLKNVKLNIPPEAKYCEVPYAINSTINDQKNVRISEISGSNGNPVVSRNTPHGWVPNNINIRPLRSYGPELYQYPDYPSCAGPRPMPMIRPHRTVHDEPNRMYPEQYYQDANVRFRPYPLTKGRHPHGRYDYVSSYSNTFHSNPTFPPHAFDPQKSVSSHSYPLYPQVPLKYIDRRMGEPLIDRYQRASPHTNLNVPYRSPIIHPAYTLQPNCIQNNMFPYPSDNSQKSGIPNKLSYSSNNKLYVDYEVSQHKKNHIPENMYSNDANHPNSMKGEVLCSNYPQVGMHGLPQYPLYRKENIAIKNFEYVPHLRNLDPSINYHNPLLRHPIHFSPNTMAISPSDSNTSNDTTQTHTTQEDGGYVSQSSTNSGRSVDFHISGYSNEQHLYRSPDYKYGFFPRNITTQIPESNKSSKVKKGLDVRQFLQMWNEGDDESSEQNKDDSIPKACSDLNSLPSQYESANKQEQLYVLGLVNVPSEELDKYEHIQKISKLPENIKGYNNIELLTQFEEAIESSNTRMFNKAQKEYHASNKSTMPKHQINTSPRPVSPLDVEAKISQSVIHKDVGCNFEIKPCSPKMLNAEIATPVQNILDERIIEKVSNPIAVNPIILHKGEKINNEKSNFNNLQNLHSDNSLKDTGIITSCKMENNNSINLIKQNYSLQDLEYNSSVCLASLPRLDNDIELNFPEINQQFISANKIESVMAATAIKDLPILSSDQIDNSKDTINGQSSEQPTPNVEADKEFTKLSKYRKRKSNIEQRENQSDTSTKTQLRTDSVIIKNPDMIKANDIIVEVSNIKFTNKNSDEDVCPSKENDDHDNITAETISKTELLNQSQSEEHNCNNLKNIGDIQKEKRNILVDTENAIDFSLSKSDNETVKICTLEEKTVDESLLNLIEEDTTSRTYCKPKLFTFTPHGIPNDALKLNETNTNTMKVNNDCSNTHNQNCNSINTAIKLDYVDKLENEKNCNLTLSQREFCDMDNTILSSTLNQSVVISEEVNSEINLLSTVPHSSQDATYSNIEDITLGFSSLKECSEQLEKDTNIDSINKINEENRLSKEEAFKNNIFKDIPRKMYDKELGSVSTVSPKNISVTPGLEYQHNDENACNNIEFDFEDLPKNIVDRDAKLPNAQNISSDKVSEDTVTHQKIFSKKKNFSFNKRLLSHVVQNLIICSEGNLKPKVEDWVNYENNISCPANCSSIYLHEDKVDTLKLEALISDTDKEAIGQSESVSVVCTNNKSLISISDAINFDNLFEFNPNSDTSEHSDNKHDVRDITHTESKIFSEDSNQKAISPGQSDSKELNCLGEVKDALTIDTQCQQNSKNTVYEDTTLNLTEIELSNIDEVKSHCRIEEETLSKLEKPFNNRRHLKRSLSDSALNIYCDDDKKILNSQNFYAIPKKRKKINPCEMMEPNLISENFCNIVQTNRRNSVSTLYDEENVSFCILIDNSCVLTEENGESDKICLAEISENVYDDSKNNCTLITENILLTDEVSDYLSSPLSEVKNTNINDRNEKLVSDFANKYDADQHTEDKTFEETWIEDVACIETVFSDDIVEDIVLDSPSSPKVSNLNENGNCDRNDPFIYSDSEHIEKIKYIYGNSDAELVETLYKTPHKDVNKTLNRRESQCSDESNHRYYDDDALEKLLSESNDKDELISNSRNYFKDSVSNTLKSLCNKNNTEKFELDLTSDNTRYDEEYFKRGSDVNGYNSSENTTLTQYDIVHSCESTFDYLIPYRGENGSPKYLSSSSPEVSSTTSEEKSCGILLKITNCNGSISSQINEFSSKSTSKLDCESNVPSKSSSLSIKRPLITKAAQKYIPPIKESVGDLKVKLPLPQQSLNKLKILKISKDKPKLDKPPYKNHNSHKYHFPKKTKPKFEDVLKSIDEIQIKMHKEKSKKQKHSIPKVVIKKNENGAHYASTSNDTDSYNPDLTGRKWQPWVFIEKNHFVDKMALSNKIKAIFNHRKNTYVLAEKFRKYKSINNAKFVITQPKLEDVSSGKLKYTIRLKHNY
ncbi:putative leucine-rich repeat-containing protein DDB_G0290503 [Battus philenor]|uniref:putative leucine-rich repeat-containing protein DDB_G0290503 n=1 Tax=Battus philenor TaxID=42288 RepID=UPI0035CF83CB